MFLMHLANFVQDSTVVVPTPETGAGLVMYLVTVAAGAASGYGVKALAAASKFVAGLSEYVKLAVIAVGSFLVLKAVTALGISLPSNPLGWSPEMVNTFIATALGWGVTKLGVKKA